jgi:hypothetical protein
MNILTLANAVANTIVIAAVLDVSFRVFGRPDHPIHNDKTALITRKTVSSVVICGALANLISLSTPQWTEILLNVGFAGNYLFSSFYDRRIANSSNSNLPAKVSKRSASSRTSGAGKPKPNPASSSKRRDRSSKR